MKIFILGTLLNLMSIIVVAQKTPEQIIEKFFQDYETKTPKEALDNLYSNMPWADRIKDDLDKVKTQFSGIQTLVGDY